MITYISGCRINQNNNLVFEKKSSYSPLPDYKHEERNYASNIMAIYNKMLLQQTATPDIQFEKFANKYNEMYKKEDEAYYDVIFKHCLNPTKETEVMTCKKEEEYNKFYQNRDDYEFLKRMQKSNFKNPSYKNQVEYLLPSFQEKSLYPEDYIQLKNMEAKIFAKQQEIFQDCKEDIVELINSRNSFAKKLGYKNFYDYKMQTIYKKTPEEFENDCKKIHEATKKYLYLSESKRGRCLDKIFGVNHDYVQPTLDFSHISQIESFNMIDKQYKKMGWDISNYPININYVKRKDVNPICYIINPETNIQIITPEIHYRTQMQQLSHEIGHAIYGANIDKDIPYFLKDSPDKITTEAFAIMMENLAEFSNHTTHWSTKEKVVRAKAINFLIAKSMFEKELYENPNQNLDNIWENNIKKYCNINKIYRQNKDWSKCYHYVSAPVYYPNYVYAEVLADQIYDSASKKLGGKIQNNQHSAEFFNNNFFAKGAMISPEETIKNITGGEGLSIDKYIAKYN